MSRFTVICVRMCDSLLDLGVELEEAGEQVFEVCTSALNLCHDESWSYRAGAFRKFRDDMEESVVASQGPFLTCYCR